jgi:peptide/nickel transport system substrate-binding protein
LPHSDRLNPARVPLLDTDPEASGVTRGDFLRATAAAGASFSLMSILAACGSEAAVTKGTVNWALGGIVPSLDTLTLADNTNKPVTFSVLEALMRIDTDGKLQPNLAEKWEQPDELTNVYTLREGVTFSDGTPLTTEDVVYSFERQLDPKLASANAYVLGTIKTVEATGEREVTIKLSSPNVQSQYSAASAVGLIVSKAFAEKQGKNLGTPNGLQLGTGPYTVESFTAGREIVLVRNEKYWGEKPSVTKHILRMFPDEQGRQVAMRTGTIDAAIQFPLAQADQWSSIKGVKTQYVPFHRLQVLSFDLTQEPWTDIAVRRAFAYGVDRAGIVKSVLSGQGEVARTGTARINWEALTPGAVDEILADVPEYEFDPERAKAELAKSPKFAKGFQATLTADEAVTLSAQAVAENMRAIGIDLKVRALPTNDFYGRILPHKDLGLTMVVFGADYPDPDNFLTALLLGANAKPNHYNLAHYKNAEVDRLFTEEGRLGGVVQKDPEKVSRQRAEILAKVAKIAMTELPYLPLASENASVATKTPVTFADFNAWYTFQPTFASART